MFRNRDEACGWNEFLLRPQLEKIFPKFPVDTVLNSTKFSVMKRVSVQEAEENFLGLLASLEADGNSIVIYRNGEPVADLVSHKRVTRLVRHPFLPKVKNSYDPTEPLPLEQWPSGKG